VGGAAQYPSAAPAALVQVPEQHCALLAHASLVWMQNEEPSWHLPWAHKPEQQSAAVVQVLPAVAQLPGFGIGTHAPPVQVPLQHCAADVHVALSMRHAVPQVPPVQLKVQQSVATAQASPALWQSLMVGSHAPEVHF
jgi:hypothetical protein